MRGALALVVTLVACGKHDKPAKDTAKVDLAACGAALKAQPPSVQAILDACSVCGDWKPIVEWNTLPQDGGPSRIAIANAMEACHAWCDPNAKQRFLATLDDARGTTSRAPWRHLGEVCKDKVSAVPDARYESAVYFALDRIAREVGATFPDALAKLELPLPAVSVSGGGVELPTVAGVDTLAAKPLAITLLGDQLLVAKLPVAHLTGDGIAIDYGGDPYPGKPLAAAAALDAPTATVLAPKGMPADKLRALVEATRGKTKLLLAVGVAAAPGWTIPRVLPTALDKVQGDTIQDVANALAHPTP